MVTSIKNASVVTAQGVWTAASAAGTWGVRHVRQLGTAAGLNLKIGVSSVVAFCKAHAVVLGIGFGITGTVLVVSMLALHFLLKQQPPALQQAPVLAMAPVHVPQPAAAVAVSVAPAVSTTQQAVSTQVVELTSPSRTQPLRAAKNKTTMTQDVVSADTSAISTRKSKRIAKQSTQMSATLAPQAADAVKKKMTKKKSPKKVTARQPTVAVKKAPPKKASQHKAISQPKKKVKNKTPSTSLAASLATSTPQEPQTSLWMQAYNWLFS